MVSFLADRLLEDWYSDEEENIGNIRWFWADLLASEKTKGPSARGGSMIDFLGLQAEFDGGSKASFYHIEIGDDNPLGFSNYCIMTYSGTAPTLEWVVKELSEYVGSDAVVEKI